MGIHHEEVNIILVFCAACILQHLMSLIPVQLAEIRVRFYCNNAPALITKMRTGRKVIWAGNTNLDKNFPVPGIRKNFF